MEMIYFDNAATTWPKPAAVRESAVTFFRRYGANPGRSGHTMSLETAEQVYRCREEAAGLFGVQDPSRVIFTQNCTHGLNQILSGALREGDHLLISDLEHNSVFRPAYRLAKERGICPEIVTTFPGDDDATLEAFGKAIRPDTKMILVTHCSNVFGFRLPVEHLAQLARRHHVLMAVDAAQSAGMMPISCDNSGFDYIAMPGHKGLYGPTGTGLLLIGKDAPPLRPLLVGGTGSMSRDPQQPDTLPDLLESGTLNTFGVLGLLAGLRFVLRVGVEQIASHETALAQKLREQLRKIPGVSVIGEEKMFSGAAPVLSFTVSGQTGEETAQLLSEKGFALRGGLHCAPLAHRKMGTLESGTARVGLGYFNTPQQVQALVRAVGAIAKER